MKTGFWEHGKRLTYFKDDEIESIKNGNFDYKALFKRSESAE